MRAIILVGFETFALHWYGPVRERFAMLLHLRLLLPVGWSRAPSGKRHPRQTPPQEPPQTEITQALLALEKSIHGRSDAYRSREPYRADENFTTCIAAGRRVALEMLEPSSSRIVLGSPQAAGATTHRQATTLGARDTNEGRSLFDLPCFGFQEVYTVDASKHMRAAHDCVEKITNCLSKGEDPSGIFPVIEWQMHLQAVEADEADVW